MIDAFETCANNAQAIIEQEEFDKLGDLLPIFRKQYETIKRERIYIITAYTGAKEYIQQIEDEEDRKSVEDKLEIFKREENIFELSILEKANKYLNSAHSDYNMLGHALWKTVHTESRPAMELQGVIFFLEWLRKKEYDKEAKHMSDLKMQILGQTTTKQDKKTTSLSKTSDNLVALCSEIETNTKGHGDPLTETQKRRLLKPENFEEFMFRYFADTQHLSSIKPLAAFHKKAIFPLLRGEKSFHIWEWFRGSGKSIIGTLHIPIWLMLNKLLKGMILVSDTAQKGEDLLDVLYANIKSNKRIHNDFGEFHIIGTPKQGKITVQFLLDSYSFSAWSLGMGQNPVGLRHLNNRPNLIVVDDADNPEVSLNQRRVEERIKYIRGSLMPCIGVESMHDGKMSRNYFIYSNNRIHPEGLTATFIDEMTNPKKTGKEMRDKLHYSQVPISIRPEGGENLSGDDGQLIDIGTPTWPEYMSRKYVTEMVLSMGWKEASMQLYHEYISDGDTFNADWIEYVDEEDVLEAPQAIGSEGKYPIEEVVIYCDPAYSTSKDACYTGIMVLVRYTEYDQHKFCIWDCWGDKVPDFCKSHMDYYLLYKDYFKCDVRCVVESSAGQEIRIDSMYENIKSKNIKYNMVPVDYDSKVKGNKVSRISTLIGPFKNKQIVVNNTLKDSGHYKLFLQQLRLFPMGSLDLPDALEGGVTYLLQGIGQEFEETHYPQERYIALPTF